MLLVAGAGVVVSGDEYDVRLWSFEPDADERTMIENGGRIVATLACIDPPVLNVEVRAPVCACGEYMAWESRLRIYTCNHEEADENPPL